MRERAVEVLVSAGSLSVPVVHARLDSTDPQQRQMAAVVLARIEPRRYNENDPGGVLYVVVWGRVAVEQEKRQGSLVRLTTVEAHTCLGEADFFDGHPHTSAAVALQDTLTLCLRHEPLIVLARQYPDLSLELINVLGARLRTASDRVAELTRTHPRALHRLFDQLT